MFPFLRMSNIYKMNPPDMNGGSNANDLLTQLLALRARLPQDDTEQPQIQQPMQQQPRLQQVASRIGHPGGSIGNPQDRDVVLGPGALKQASIGLEPDKGDLLDPKTKAQLEVKQQEFEQSMGLKKSQLAEEDKYHTGTLDSKNKLGEENTTIRANRADVYRFKAMHPDMQFKISKGGNIVGLNPLTGESVDTGVDSGTLSDEDKLNILGSQHMDEINAKGSNAMDLQNLRGDQNLAGIAARVAGQKDVAASKPDRGLLPTQQRVNQNMNAHELVNKHPELARYVIFNSDSTFSVSKNAPKEVADQINSVLYPDKTDTSKPKTTTSPTTDSSERVKVTKDGKTFSLPKSQLDDAKKQGYTVVGG